MEVPDLTADDLIPRVAVGQLEELAGSFRVVIVSGPRQAGKTTLLELFRSRHGGEYRTFDDPRTLDTAQADPEAFAGIGERPLIIDEVQLGGDRVIRAIKRVTDTDHRPGRFVLSGSAKFLTVPSLSESLAGRAVFVDLWPPSMAERTRTDSRFVGQIFTTPADLIGPASTWTRDDYIGLICEGGFPEAISGLNPRILRSWFEGYVRTVISRDVEHFAHVRDTGVLVQLLELLAIRSGSTIVVDDLARSLEVTSSSVRDYMSYFDTVFLTSEVRPWSSNLTSRITKAPKRFLTDTGLASFLTQESPRTLRTPGNPLLGGLTETLVYTELLKLQAMTAGGFGISHYRDRDDREIDFILEGPGRSVVAIEVKSSLSPRENAGRHLAWLRDKLGEAFTAGIVLYLGPDARSLGDRLMLLPISALWDHARLPEGR